VQALRPEAQVSLKGEEGSDPIPPSDEQSTPTTTHDQKARMRVEDTRDRVKRLLQFAVVGLALCGVLALLRSRALSAR
jgi:hypothetical protein